MKATSKGNSTTNKAQLFAALLLTGIISVANEFALRKSAIATPVVVSTSQDYKVANSKQDIVVSQQQSNSQTTIQVQRQNVKRSGLPLNVVNAVTKDLSRRVDIPQDRLRVIAYSKETWRNGCLEVLKPGEMCTQALVPGYRVTVSDGGQRWVYHTNSNGRNLRLASGGNSGDTNLQLPDSIKSQAIADAAQRLQKPASEFFIMQAQQKTWKDGCLELRDANTICSQVLVPGWRVIVGTKGQSLVYHTNKSGSVIKLNTKASEITDNGLPTKVKDTVLQSASKLIGSSRVRVSRAEQTTFTDSCLNLGGPAESCFRGNQRGWKITVKGARQTLVYHTSIDGNQVRLNVNASELRLPRKVRSAVLREARNISGLSNRTIRIVSFKPANWGYGCEDFSFNNPCDRTAVSGWEVTVSGNSQNWVFLSDGTGNQVKLSNQSSQPQSQLPGLVEDKILRDASQWSGLSRRRIQILGSERKIWSNPCYLTFNRICNKAFIRTPGWIVTVKANNQTWIYHANDDASTVVLDRTKSLTQRAAAAIKGDAARRSQRASSAFQIRVIEVERLNERQGNTLMMKATLSDGRETWTYRFQQDGSDFEIDTTANLPQSVESAVLSDVRNRVSSIVSSRNIVEVEQKRWRNGCLGIVNERKRRYCFYRIVDGYRVTVKIGSELFVYHTDSRSRVILNETVSRIDGNQNQATVIPVRIPRSELPSPLTRGIVFRQISSGGFAGQTYETILFEDGRIMRYRMGDMNDKSRSVRQASRQQVNNFQRLLQRQRDEFRNMSYPASRGAADFITYTLTSRDGTVKFNDTSRNNLPQDLLTVVENWNQILRS
ncbi:hypothetical protein NIES267_07980 [Calothrix parasitica NIES-267]|uniref:Uncharacterized protein n=1 Tax=Calothrix parasitica NIES-267 TaxID=1973488 RepID=A0A1Z4LJB6_9CYAN|nr:hypothetical protein NIES267_07980 [Calothrix parasitica NIES-267]